MAGRTTSRCSVGRIVVEGGGNLRGNLPAARTSLAEAIVKGFIGGIGKENLPMLLAGVPMLFKGVIDVLRRPVPPPPSPIRRTTPPPARPTEPTSGAAERRPAAERPPAGERRIAHSYRTSGRVKTHTSSFISLISITTSIRWRI